jgi:hypothetical protein
MNIGKRELVQQLERLSREQTPDNWCRFRDQILKEKASNRAHQYTDAQDAIATNKRSKKSMIRKTDWIVALSSSTALIIAISLVIIFLFPKPDDIRFEAGKAVTLANGSLYMNVVTPSSGKIGMPPDAEYVDLTFADLPDLFGRAPIPPLPDGFKADSDTITAMMFRSGTVFLMNGISFSANADDAQAARVYFDLNDQGELPISDCVYGAGETSLLDGVDLMMGVQTLEEDGKSFDMYYAQFVANGIGYRIRATHMAGADFLAILEAVIKG